MCFEREIKIELVIGPGPVKITGDYGGMRRPSATTRSPSTPALQYFHQHTIPDIIEPNGEVVETEDISMKSEVKFFYVLAINLH